MTNEHLKALQNGRKKAAAKRRRESIKRVKAFKAWVKADADWHLAWAKGETAGPKPPIPAVPSDDDYEKFWEAGEK